MQKPPHTPVRDRVDLMHELGGFEVPVVDVDEQFSKLQDERDDLLARFAAELVKPTLNGSRRRAQGAKPPWYNDPDHERAVFSHITNWKAGQKQDPDSGAHPLVHAAWRLLAIACTESGNVPTDVVTIDRCPRTGFTR